MERAAAAPGHSSMALVLATTGGEHRISRQVATLGESGHAAVVQQRNQEAMTLFLHRMHQAAGKYADETRMHMLAARAMQVGVVEDAFA